MAAITAALIGGTALTASTVAAGATLTAAGSAIAGGISNLSAASKASGLAAKAQQDAAQAMEQARKANSVNNYAALGINKDLYNQYTEAGLSTAAQGIQAVQQGDQRGAAAGVGQISNAMNQNLAQIRSAENSDMIRNQQMVAQDNARRQGTEVAMDTASAQGSQNYARNQQLQAAALNSSGMQAITTGVTSGLKGAAQAFGPKDVIGAGVPPTTPPAGTVISPTVAGASSPVATTNYMAGVGDFGASAQGVGLGGSQNVQMYDASGAPISDSAQYNPSQQTFTAAQLQAMNITPQQY